MHDSTHRTDAHLRRALEDAAPDLGLELEDEHPTKLSVGALLPAAYTTGDTDNSAQPADAGEDDDGAIRDLIQRWENTEHDEALEVIGDVTTDPYVAVSSDSTQLVDSAGLKEWTESDAYRAQADSFERHEGGERKVSDVSIEYLGPALACCTYTMEEQGKNGTYVSNSATIVRKTGSGWRITVVTKHATVESGS